VKRILIEMEEQKQTYEQKAKEALQKMLEDKLQTEQKLLNSQRSLAEAREDLALRKEHDTALRAELSQVTTAHAELTNSFQALQSELQRAEEQKERLSRELRLLRDEHSELLHGASALRSDNDRQAGHIRHLQGMGTANGLGSALQKHRGDKENTPKATALRAAGTPTAANLTSPQNLLISKEPPKLVLIRLKSSEKSLF
uniref:Uncharacterized protein n=1 Tax=Malurus cyaneus samueli TaxID=2593467 RepID=A0A8C5TAN5_9PASS